jgi:hypothetical protein
MNHDSELGAKTTKDTKTSKRNDPANFGDRDHQKDTDPTGIRAQDLVAICASRNAILSPPCIAKPSIGVFPTPVSRFWHMVGSLLPRLEHEANDLVQIPWV